MATLNTSQDGPAITKSYQAVVDTPLPSGPAANSPTYGQWVVYSVQAPLVNAFQQDSAKDSVLKVFRTGEGELVDLLDEFSEGKVQFGFVKIKDPNTSLPKCVLVAWCGEGVPERTKGYFTSHLAAVSKLLHGYHVQVTARTDADLYPEAIIRKVSDSSGSKYSGDRGPVAEKPPPPVASKPVFTPSKVGGSGGFAPLGSRARQPAAQGNVDEDGWGEDAPPVTRSQIQKVESAYKPTKVNMAELASQKPDSTRAAPPEPASNEGVVKGAYQPIGKVDIAAIRREAKEKGDPREDRPTPVKGAYEPVGKVDLADIRARSKSSEPSTISPARTGASNESGSNASGGLTSERMTSMPKPKVSNKFGSSNFTGTKAPAPGGFENKPAPAAAAPIGAASKTFADEGGKTPAQIWAEKKARERGNSGAAEASKPVASQTSGGGGWQSGYGGKKWGPVQTTHTGQTGISSNRTDEESQREEPASPPAGGVSAMKDRFKQSAPIQAGQAEDGPPPMDFSSKPNAGLPIREEKSNMPPPPAQPPRSPEPPSPELRPSSPIQIAKPVARTDAKEMEPPEERFSPPQMPTRSMAEAVPSADKLPEESQVEDDDPARGAGEAAAMSTQDAASGKQAIAQYDYEKAEDNELELKENELITHIDMVDEDWWMGQNSRGETGLFPANYVELTGEGAPLTAGDSHSASMPAAPRAHTAIAQYDYEAAEDNEISFPDGAKIINVEFPDEDWWLGEYNGKSGLFPANYVELDQ